MSVSSLDERRQPCRCRIWEQSWRPETPERCARCGGMFPPKSVAARRPQPGEPWFKGSA